MRSLCWSRCFSLRWNFLKLHHPRIQFLFCVIPNASRNTENSLAYHSLKPWFKLAWEKKLNFECVIVGGPAVYKETFITIFHRCRRKCVSRKEKNYEARRKGRLNYVTTTILDALSANWLNEYVWNAVWTSFYALCFCVYVWKINDLLIAKLCFTVGNVASNFNVGKNSVQYRSASGVESERIVMCGIWALFGVENADVAKCECAFGKLRNRGPDATRFQSENALPVSSC